MQMGYFINHKPLCQPFLWLLPHCAAWSYFNPIRIIRDSRLGRKPRSDKRWSLLDSQGAGCSLVWSNRKFRHRSVRLVTEENHFQVKAGTKYHLAAMNCHVANMYIFKNESFYLKIQQCAAALESKWCRSRCCCCKSVALVMQAKMQQRQQTGV